jgi:hypothetical protein
MKSGDQGRRPITAEEESLFLLHWQAGFSEQYIAQKFNRNRFVIRRRVEALGLPSTRTIQHQRAQEWLNAKIGERGARQARGQEDPR